MENAAPGSARAMRADAVLVAVVAYEAEGFIESLLDRVPSTIAGHRPTVLVADDASTDTTVVRAEKWAAAHPDHDVRVISQTANLGYGGNQKACYRWAAENGFDAVALLHGDEQYPPEMIPDLLGPILDGDRHAVFGCRMTEPRRAREGGMPLDRYLGNRVLSRALNLLSGSAFDEWFSGFRAYRVKTLDELGLDDLPDGFDFDTAITLRLLGRGVDVLEVPIPTRYADEVSRVPLLRTGLAGLAHGVRHARTRRSA